MNELRKGKLVALPIENLSMMRETRIIYEKDFTHLDLLQEITRIMKQRGITGKNGCEECRSILHSRLT